MRFLAPTPSYQPPAPNSQFRGSALLVTLVIVGVVGLTLAGTGRLVTNSLRTANALEEGALAAAAAEAGIEEGLLRWRFNHDLQLPQLVGQDMQESVRRAVRTNLTTGAVAASVALGEDIARTSAASQYDLRVWYQAPGVSGKLIKDQTLELDASALGGRTILFDYRMAAGETGCALIEAKVFQVASGGSLQEEKTVTTRESQQQAVIDLSTGATGYRVRIKAYIFAACDTSLPAADSSAVDYQLTVRDLPSDRTNQLLDTGVTVIESTGYFGASKRTLRALADRRSGTILEIYDYTLFAEMDIRMDIR